MTKRRYFQDLARRLQTEADKPIHAHSANFMLLTEASVAAENAAELYKALTEIVAHFSYVGDDHLSDLDAIDVARTALAKADGR